jgi:hypothetical protein
MTSESLYSQESEPISMFYIHLTERRTQSRAISLVFGCLFAAGDDHGSSTSNQRRRDLHIDLDRVPRRPCRVLNTALVGAIVDSSRLSTSIRHDKSGIKNFRQA